MREHKSERSIRMTVSLASSRPSWRKPRWRVAFHAVQHQAPDRPANALVRAMARSGTARADSGSEPNLVDPRLFNSLRTLYWRGRCFGPAASISAARETDFCGQRLAGELRRRARENDRNSVRRPGYGS